MVVILNWFLKIGVEQGLLHTQDMVIPVLVALNNGTGETVSKFADRVYTKV